MDSSQFHHSVYPLLGYEIHRWSSQNLFKGVENYFTNSLFYQDPLEATEDSSSEDSDSGNDVDTEPEAVEEYLWEINPLVTNIDKLGFNNTANVESEWFINENLNLAYFWFCTVKY